MKDQFAAGVELKRPTVRKGAEPRGTHGIGIVGYLEKLDGRLAAVLLAKINRETLGHPAGRRTRMTVSGQQSVSYSYDDSNRLVQIAQGGSGVTLGYDADGRRTSLVLPNGVNMGYSYDTASQLTAISYGSLGTITYSYDLAGRRTMVGGSFARTGLPNGVTNVAYNQDNQLTRFGSSNLTYDANGNLTNDGTSTYTWSARNQLVSISGAVSANFQYDAFGRRVTKTVSGTTQYLYDGVNPIEELSGTAVVATTLAGLGVDEYFQRTDSAGPANFMTDAVGSTLALTNAAGALGTQYTYEPFGNMTFTGPASGNPFQFAGRENDSTGLYYYRARFYSPLFERFISEDPAGPMESPNLFAYGEQNPLELTDPLGLCTGKGSPGSRPSPPTPKQRWLEAGKGVWDLTVAGAQGVLAVTGVATAETGLGAALAIYGGVGAVGHGAAGFSEIYGAVSGNVQTGENIAERAGTFTSASGVGVYLITQDYGAARTAANTEAIVTAPLNV